MAREYAVQPPIEGFIVKVYNEGGLSYREAKKQLRQEYLNASRRLRALREKDIRPREWVEPVEYK